MTNKIITTKLKVQYKSKILSGILIKDDQNYITLKLDNGYNINMNKKEIKILETKNTNFNTNTINNEINNNSKNNKNIFDKNLLPKITLIHTGGTIASKVDYNTGAVSSKFTPEELLNLYPELNKLVNLDVKMIGNLFSEDMRFSHYNLMLDEIENASNNNSIGIIISHGTDTLHYTSAALQYALENLNIPVILVGAQRSSDRASSDAYSNLEAAVGFIIQNSHSENNFKRVGICMHEDISDNNFLILDSINAKKMHSTKRDAFKQINYLPYARIVNKKIEILRDELNSPINSKKLSITKYNTFLKIGFFKAHPNLNPEEIEMLSIYDAVIFEGTGLGHLAVNEVDENTKIHIKNLEQLEKLSKTTKLVMGNQTVYGQTNMDIYSSGRYIKKYFFGNYMNLTTETLFIRTAHILSKDKNNFEKIWTENLEKFNTNISINIE